MSQGPERLKARPEVTQETLAEWEPDQSPRLLPIPSALGSQGSQGTEKLARLPSPGPGGWGIRTGQSSSESRGVALPAGLFAQDAVVTRLLPAAAQPTHLAAQT